MIKFFRKIRQNSLSEGKTGKYFKYAIGEIVLVENLASYRVMEFRENAINAYKQINALIESNEPLPDFIPAWQKQEEIYKQEIARKNKELASQTLHLMQKTLLSKSW